MKLKTSELTDAALDWAVAKAEYTDRRVEIHDTHPSPQVERGPGSGDRYGIGWFSFHPSTNRSQGGLIIEREAITTAAPLHPGDLWGAWKWIEMRDSCKHNGPTPLIAAMRCFVASKLGDEVDVPDELLKG
jgi:hypothetical protein